MFNLFWTLFQPIMQVAPSFEQILTTASLRPFKNSVSEKTFKHIMQYLLQIYMVFHCDLLIKLELHLPKDYLFTISMNSI